MKSAFDRNGISGTVYGSPTQKTSPCQISVPPHFHPMASNDKKCNSFLKTCKKQLKNINYDIVSSVRRSILGKKTFDVRTRFSIRIYSIGP